MHTKLQKWISWINTIEEEILHLSSHQYVYSEVGKIIKENPDIQKHSAFYDLLNLGYAALALSAVRRQSKYQKESISLARLLKEIAENSNLLSREFYLTLYKEKDLIDLGNADFDQLVGIGKDHIDKNDVLKDIDDLIKTTQVCEDFVDKRIAHTDEREPKRIPTFSELEDCIEKIISLMQKYYSLLTGTIIASIPPTFQYDWKKIFHEKWIK